MELRQGSLSAAGVIESFASGGRLVERMTKIEIELGALAQAVEAEGSSLLSCHDTTDVQTR
jgi:hypothetical protein